jgi:hypothetical protein
MAILTFEVTATARFPLWPTSRVTGTFARAPRRISSTDIQVSDQARDYVAVRGGTLFLRVRHNRCCSGGLTFLDASTSAHNGFDDYEKVGDANPEVRLSHQGGVLPNTVSVVMHGKVRPHLVALWDGCAYRL